MPASSDRGRRVMAASTVGLAVIDKSGAIRSTNPALLRMTGLTRGQILKRDLDDLISRDHGGQLREWLNDPHTACPVDLEFVGANGSIRVTGWVNPLAPGDGDPDDHAVLQLVPRELSVDIARAAARFDAIADELSDGVIITDTDLTVLQFNRRAAATLPEVEVGRGVQHALPAHLRDHLNRALRTGVHDRVETALELGDGNTRVLIRELRDSIDQLVGLAFTLQADPSIEAAAGQGEAATTDSDASSTNDEQNSQVDPTCGSHVVWTLDHDGPIDASASARDLIGLAADDPVEGVRLLNILTEKSCAELVQAGLAQLAPGGSWRSELDLRDRAGEPRRARVDLRHHRTEPETWSLSAVLIEARETSSAPPRDLGTGLPTAQVLRERLTRAIERAVANERATCLVAIGIDDLTSLPGNADDIVLVVADALRRQIRPGDTLARTETDTFEIIRDDVVDERDALRFAERVRANFDRPMVIDGLELALRVSAGVALTEPDLTDADSLRSTAAAALADARARGGCQTAGDDVVSVPRGAERALRRRRSPHQSERRE